MEKKFKLVVASFVAAIVFTANVNAGITITCKTISNGGMVCCATSEAGIDCTYVTPGGGT